MADRTEEDKSIAFKSYMETALWSSVDDNDDAMDDNYSIEDLDPCTKDKMYDELQEFVDNYAALIDKDDRNTDISHFVHNFWLTRNGHGAGFWDGDYKNGDLLSEISDQKYGHIDLYIGDDGKIYNVTQGEKVEDDDNFVQQLFGENSPFRCTKEKITRLNKVK